jgi:hypothetical protein
MYDCTLTPLQIEELAVAIGAANLPKPILRRLNANLTNAYNAPREGDTRYSPSARLLTRRPKPPAGWAFAALVRTDPASRLALRELATGRILSNEPGGWQLAEPGGGPAPLAGFLDVPESALDTLNAAIVYYWGRGCRAATLHVLTNLPPTEDTDHE